MWMVFSRAMQPDVAVWPGRRWLALADAVAWPGGLAVIVANVDAVTGIVAAAVLSLCVLEAIRRSWVAWTANARYRFTTARWARVLAAVFVAGLVMSVAT
jgi:hypothetical protein